MAKHKSRGRFRAIPFSVTLPLLTLADEVVLAVNMFPNNSTVQTYCISADCLWAIRGVTAGEGPLQVGYAHGDYSVSEIKEALEAGASFDPGDKVEQEQARRLVRRAGQFDGQSATEVLNDGRPKRTKLGITITQGFNLALWVKNKRGGAMTTGAVLELSGTLYVRQSA